MLEDRWMDTVIPVTTFSANSYLLVGEQIVAVDVGAPSVARRMVEIVSKELGRPAGDIGWVVATHYHVDHVGGVGELLRLTPAKVLLPEGIRGHLERHEPLVFPPPRRWINMMTNVEIGNPAPRLEDIARISRIGLPLGLNGRVPFGVEGYLKDGEALPGGNGFVVISTPGHSPCSVCFYASSSRTLITGDTILGGRSRPMLNPFVADEQQILSSAGRLAQFEIERILPGHGRVWEGAFVMEGILDTLAPEGLASLAFHLKSLRGS
jgi:glyoxylase-like metal-dependent hydrolase (beta-lactamase superfamily II)